MAHIGRHLWRTAWKPMMHRRDIFGFTTVPATKKVKNWWNDDISAGHESIIIFLNVEVPATTWPCISVIKFVCYCRTGKTHFANSHFAFCSLECCIPREEDAAYHSLLRFVLYDLFSKLGRSFMSGVLKTGTTCAAVGMRQHGKGLWEKPLAVINSWLWAQCMLAADRLVSKVLLLHVIVKYVKRIVQNIVSCFLIARQGAQHTISML